MIMQASLLLAALFAFATATQIDVCSSIYSNAVSLGADPCSSFHDLSVCVTDALASDSTLMTQGYQVLGDTLAANLACDLTSIPFTTFLRQDSGTFVFEADSSKTLTINRFERNATDFQDLASRTQVIEAANSNAVAGAVFDEIVNTSAIQQQAITQITAQIASSHFESANSRVADLEGILSGLQRTLTYDLPGLVASLKGDISQRIANQAVLLAIVSTSVSTLVTSVSTSISSSFSATLSSHSTMRASLSTNRYLIYQNGSSAVVNALNLEVSRLAYEAPIVSDQSNQLSNAASNSINNAISTESSRADAACASLLLARIPSLFPQSGANDGLTCTTKGRPYFSTSRLRFFICNGTYWTPVLLGGFQESTILTGSAYVAPMVALLGYRWTLCYRGSVELWSNWAFKDQCGHGGPTLIVNKYGSRVFGGYTEVSWDNHQIYVNSPKSFLFRYNPTNGYLETALSTGSEYGILQYHPFTSNNGPYFGTGDYYISGQTAYFNNNGYFVVQNVSVTTFSNTWMSGVSGGVTLNEMEAYVKV